MIVKIVLFIMYIFFLTNNNIKFHHSIHTKTNKYNAVMSIYYITNMTSLEE